MTFARSVRAVCAAGFVILAFAAGGECAPASKPLIPPSQRLAVEELHPGMKGFGKSVFSGTKVERFGITVLGVLRKVDFSGDVILISLDSGPPVTKGYGVIAGMSGSPIYVKGKLIGALAYAWSFSKQPIAGVTPIAQMLEAYQPGSAEKPLVGSLEPTRPLRIEGQRIERALVLPPSGGPAPASGQTATLVRITTPVLVSGGGPGLISRLRTALEPRGLRPVSGAGAMASVKARMEPGAAVGARLVGGDLDLTAVGTVTYVKDGVVLAFGHPLLGLGTTDVPLTAAYVHGILSSSELSFKFASGGQTLGRFTEDRASCIGGKLGGKSSLVRALVRVSDRDRDYARRYRLEVIQDRELTPVLLNLLLGGAIESIGPPTEGTSRMKLSLRAGGLPTIERENSYAMEGDLDLLALLLGGWEGATSPEEELSQILEVLQRNDFREAKVGDLEVSVEISKQRRVARVERVFTPRRTVKPGEEVPIEVVLRVVGRGLVTRTERITVPTSCPPGRLGVGIAGGSSANEVRGRLAISHPKPDSLAQMVDQMVKRPRNNELVVLTALPTVGIETRGLVFRDLPPAVLEVLQASQSTRMRALRDHAEQRAETDWVTSGYAVLSLTVEGDQRDKGGRPPLPEHTPSAFEEYGSPFAGLFSGLGGESYRARVSAGEEEEIEDSDLPEMPSWEEVSSAGEEGLAEEGARESEASAPQPQGEGSLTRVASVWNLTDPKETAKGKGVAVARDRTGALRLAPQVSPVGDLAERGLWSVAAGPDGSVYVGAWADGQLRRVSADGSVSTVLETADAVIQSVAVRGDGTVYAAGAPSGTIYRLSPRGEITKLCQLEAQNVWALALDGRGYLWAATGPGGKLYRISPLGAATVGFAAADRHITALAVMPEGRVYCGTSPLGKVYALDGERAARSVFEVEKAAVQSLAVGPEGSVYVGTSPDGRVLRIGAEGAARELLKTQGKHVLALHVRSDGTLWVASGPEARVYVGSGDTTWTELPPMKAAFVAGVAEAVEGRIYLTAPDTGRLIRLDMNAQGEGTYTSAVHDAGAVAQWGAVRHRARCSEDSSISVWTRTGMTAYPDSTWSDWQEAVDNVVSPPGRYLQARVDLVGAPKDPPQVENLEISYLPANRAPEVSVIAPAANAIWSGKQTVKWNGKDPDGDRLSYEVSYSVDGGATWVTIEGSGQSEKPEQPKAAEEEGAEEKPAEAGHQDSRSKERQEGKASRWPEVAQITRPARRVGMAPDGAGLAGPGVGAGREEEGEEPEKGEEPQDGDRSVPAPAGSARSATSLSWDTADGPDGLYRIRVTATDRGANALDPRSGEAVSQLFTVDNTPPEFPGEFDLTETGPPPGSFVVVDRTSYITSVAMKVDEGEWMPVAAMDGIFDSGKETAVVVAAALPNGMHAVEIRAGDAAGNTGTTTFRYQK